jgi:hypothetical protein
VFGVFWLALAVSIGCHHTPQTLPEHTTSGSAQRDFDRRISAYISLRERLARTLPAVAETAHPGANDVRQSALRALIAKARPNAKAGDVFEVAMQTSIRLIVQRVLDGPDGTSIRATLMDENPTRAQIQINSGYPVAIPVSTMTTTLLAALPRLPDGLEYHFVGSRLVLLDTRAWMIVDFVEYVLK